MATAHLTPLDRERTHTKVAAALGSTRPRLLVKKRHAAEMLDMSLSTVDRWIEAGHLEKVVLGTRHVRVTMASIEAMLAGAPRS